MNPRHPFLCFDVTELPVRVRSVFGAVSLLCLITGCESPKAGFWTAPPAAPIATAPMQDPRTEAQLIAMENEYIAAKNSSPTHQAQAEAEKKRKEPERAVAAQNQSASEKDPDPKR